MITLGARTDFSFMRGFGTPKQWLARAKEIEIPALAITDYVSTWGHAFFADAFKGSGIEVLYGVQVPVVTLLEKDPRHDILTLIARTGHLEDLYRAMTLAEEQGYYRPRLTWPQVQKLVEEEKVIAIANQVSLGNLENMAKVKGIYAAARPHLDVMHKIIKTGDFKVVPSYVPLVPRVEDRRTFSLMQAISEGHRIGEVDQSLLPLLRRSEYDGLMHAAGFTAQQAWFDAAAEVVEQCKQPFPKAKKIKLSEDADDAMAKLHIQALEGASRLGINVASGPYKDRLEREMKVIREKEFGDYFLFVGDLVRWAKERMFIGPGRGSSAGSVLCWFLGITEVDPLKFGTLFERFIDITRPDWPDIDVDFPDVRRDEVYAYLKEKYGADHVARLGTIGEFGGKSAINDTAKATGVDYGVARELGRLVEGYTQSGIQLLPLAKIFTDDEIAKNFIDKYPSLAYAADLEDHARQHGVHAAGVVVLTEQSIYEFGALDKRATIAMDMKQAEKVGLIKMDVLGLRTLSVIQDVCDQVGMDPKELYSLSWEEQKTFDVFNNDRVTGVFQFEGDAVRNLTKGIRVEKFADLAALTSLARPGPLKGGAAELWVKRRSGKQEWDFVHPSLAPHLAQTFGTIVYQEQAMAVVRDLGGFDEPSVNGFRRAVGKKDPEKLRSYEGQFLEGCKTWHERATKKLEGGESATQIMLASLDAPLPIPDDVAQNLWDEMCEFGSYAFNLAHAVAYGMISYMAAHLKAHHPLEFAVANLRNASDVDQAKQLLRELVAEGHAYVPFDPQKSVATWAVFDGVLYGGFDGVIGIGPKTTKELLTKRAVNGDDWMEKLTDSQRDRLTRPDNTPWHSLSYFGRKYAKLYKDPENFISADLPAGVTPPVYQIKDIEPVKGTYRFLGRIVKRIKKDANSPEKVTKRGGQVYSKNTHFVNIIWSDDTGEIGSTVNRFKVDKFSWLLDNPTEGKDYLVKGEIIGDGKWIFIDQVLEMTDVGTSEEQPGPGTGTAEGVQPGGQADADSGAGSGPQEDEGRADRPSAVHEPDRPAGRGAGAGTGQRGKSKVARPRRSKRA